MPVAPEVVQAMAEQDVPESILEGVEEEDEIDTKVAKKKETQEEKEFQLDLADLFSDKIEVEAKPKALGLTDTLANAFSDKGFEGEILEGDGYIDITFSTKPDKAVDEIKQTVEKEVDKINKKLADKGVETQITKNKDGSLHVVAPMKFSKNCQNPK